MPILITEHDASIFPEYDSIPIRFEVRSQLVVTPLDGGLGGLALVEPGTEVARGARS